MLGMGLTLSSKDLFNLRFAGKLLIIGVCLQYVVMPISAWLIATAMGLPKLLALGMILVGSCPGGTASNVVVFLARGDVALSVGMTTLSTLLSPLVTPMWIWILASTWLSIDPFQLFLTIAKIVLIPIVLGATIRQFWQPGRWLLEGVLPVFSIAIIAWIVGVIVALNHDQFTSVTLIIFFAVVIHNAMGLFTGYFGTKYVHVNEIQRRTISIEVGMQNSGLAVALAVAHFGPLAAIPGAIFSVWHNITGPLLASIWRRQMGIH